MVHGEPQTLSDMAVILVVDDEEFVIYLTRVTLERIGHKIYTARSGEAGEWRAATLPVLDLLIVDHGIPPDGGRQLAERLTQARPGLKVMQFSGYPEEYLRREEKLMPGAVFLHKPFLPKQLQQIVTALLAASAT